MLAASTPNRSLMRKGCQATDRRGNDAVSITFRNLIIKIELIRLQPAVVNLSGGNMVVS